MSPSKCLVTRGTRPAYNPWKYTDNIPNNQVISKCDCNSKHKTPTECDSSDDYIMMKNIDVPATMNKKLIQIFGCFYICITGKIVL